MSKIARNFNQFCMCWLSQVFWFHLWIETSLHRTISGISHLLKPLVAAVDTFIKVLLQKYAFKPSERALFSLRAKYGGMGLIIPTKIFQEEYENSGEITNEIQLQDTPVSTAKKNNNNNNNNKNNNSIKNQKKAERCKTARSNK